MSALLWWCDFAYTICRVTLPTERVSWNCRYLQCSRLSTCHAPHGACELKYLITFSAVCFCFVTLPTERVSWNLVLPFCYAICCIASRSPRSVWVEIDSLYFRIWFDVSHAPHGACELKLLYSVLQFSFVTSRSPRSVWVEIFDGCLCVGICLVTLPTERVSWNFQSVFLVTFRLCHAPHGACELKWLY